MVFSSFSQFIVDVLIVLTIIAPLVIQFLLYNSIKLILKKIPKNVLYTVCLIINTILLAIIKETLIKYHFERNHI